MEYQKTRGQIKIKKYLLVLLVIIFCQLGLTGRVWAEIQTFTLDHFEAMDTEHTGKVKTLPLPGPKKLIISGLGTDKITAQCHIYALEEETQIYPINKNIVAGHGPSDWYYTDFGNMVIIIQITGDNVKVHELGEIPDTLVGTKDK